MIELDAMRMVLTAIVIGGVLFVAHLCLREMLKDHPARLFQITLLAAVLTFLLPICVLFAPNERGLITLTTAPLVSDPAQPETAADALSGQSVFGTSLDSEAYPADRRSASAEVQAGATRGTAMAAGVVLLAIWVLGILLVGTYFMAGYIQISRAMRRSHPLVGVSEPAVCLSPFVTCPCVCRPWRPVILLPASFRPDEQMYAAVIEHERHHIRRGDLWWLLLAQVGVCLFWWLPFTWYFRRQLSLYSEICADLDATATLGQRPYTAGLARGLLELDRCHHGDYVSAGFPTHLQQRIAFLSGQSEPRPPSKPFSILLSAVSIIALSALTVFPVFSIGPSLQDAEHSIRSIAGPSDNPVVQGYVTYNDEPMCGVTVEVLAGGVFPVESGDAVWPAVAEGSTGPDGFYVISLQPLLAAAPQQYTLRVSATDEFKVSFWRGGWVSAPPVTRRDIEMRKRGVILQPRNGVTVATLTPLVVWTGPPEAVSYDLSLMIEVPARAPADFSYEVFHAESDISESEWRVPDALLSENQTYLVDVIGKNANGTVVSRSECVFQTGPAQ